MRLTRAISMGVVGTAVLALQVPASAQAGSGAGSVQIAFAAPDGVAFNVGLNGKTAVVAGKAPSGTSSTAVLDLPTGAYHVTLPTVTVDGVRYTGQSSRPEVVVRAGQTAPLSVTYAPEPGATRLHATEVTRTGLDLAWTAAEGSRFELRRAAGSVAPAKRHDGQAVTTSGTTAADRGLEAGTEYSYSLFTQHHSRWYGPLSITVSTEAAAGSDRASFVAAPSTLIARPDDVSSVVPGADGVRVELAAHVRAPLLGSAIVLPASAVLPGGFLGVVVGLAPDGRVVQLEAGGLADAFDYYDLDVTDFVTVEQQQEVPVEPAAAAVLPSTPSVDRAPTRGRTLRSAGVGAASFSALKAVKTECGKTRVDGNFLSFDPSIELGGRFSTHVDKYSFLGAEIPTGASVDTAVTATVTGAAKVEATTNVRCNIKLPRVFQVFSTYPVPMGVSLRPTIEFNVEGILDLENVGVTATGGVHAKAQMGVKGVRFSSGPIMEAGLLTPVVKTANGAVNVRVGGELIVGPAAGSADFGVIAGIGGEAYPVDLRVSPHWPFPDPRMTKCLDVSAAFTGRLTLTAQAFLGKKLSVSGTHVLWDGSQPYFGSPWSLPDGCEKLPAVGTPDSLLGPGVDKVEDEIGGTPDQWGHVDGFVPGKRTWVLSTGRIGDALGAPSAFASTDLGVGGDSQLSTLSGRPTYDAAAYQVTVVPKGSTLKVRYVFASEEYPEYAGSDFNDVMAVRVGGADCGNVPGTSLAVSVNTINAETNSQFYVDNTTGAAGYATSMDGLTVPLTCSVPVTPGVPVTVRIAVADSSDGIYDSAVALVDGGIYSE